MVLFQGEIFKGTVSVVWINGSTSIDGTSDESIIWLVWGSLKDTTPEVFIVSHLILIQCDFCITRRTSWSHPPDRFDDTDSYPDSNGASKTGWLLVKIVGFRQTTKIHRWINVVDSRYLDGRRMSKILRCFNDDLRANFQRPLPHVEMALNWGCNEY